MFQQKFQAVMQGGKFFDGVLDGIRRAAAEGAYGGRGHDVVKVMGSLEPEAVGGVGRLLVSHPVVEEAVAVVDARGHRPAGAEGKQRRPDGGGQLSRIGIIGIEQGIVSLPLIGEDARLGGYVCVVGVIAVEVVLLEIEQHADEGPEAADSLQLEAADFGNDESCAAAVQGIFNQGVADIAAQKRLDAGAAKHLRHEFDGGGLAVGAGDRDHRSADKAVGQLDLADDLHAPVRRRPQRRGFQRNTRADHNQVGGQEQGKPVAAGFNRNALLPESAQRGGAQPHHERFGTADLRIRSVELFHGFLVLLAGG
ncbi:MAG: hypothetical protein BWY77_00572 [bacterium ADurb.Bin431]|nr:MAG: hypothetical protein BWY77_00572 [bacterium ADurb.Bin431]